MQNPKTSKEGVFWPDQIRGQARWNTRWMIRGYDKVLCVKQTGEQLFQMTRDSRRAQISRRCLLISGDQVQEVCEIARWNFGFTVGRKSSHHSISMIYMHHFYVFLDVGICPVYMCPYYTMLQQNKGGILPSK